MTEIDPTNKRKDILKTVHDICTIGSFFMDAGKQATEYLDSSLKNESIDKKTSEETK